MPDHDHSPGAAHMLPGITCTDAQHCPPPQDKWAAMVPDPHPAANCGPLTLTLSPGDQCPTCGTTIPGASDEQARAAGLAVGGSMPGDRSGLNAALGMADAPAEGQPCAFCRDLQALFDMQQKRMAKATARWRAADPATRQHVLPDLGDLLAWLMAETDRARAALELGEVELVPNEALAAIPEEHRRLLARWLAAQSTLLRPSWLFPAQTTLLARDVLRGAAVTLVDPLSEDSTVSHAAEVLSELFFPADEMGQ